MGFNGDIFVLKVLSVSIFCMEGKLDFFEGNEGEILKFQ